MKIIDYHFGSLRTESKIFDKDVVISKSKIFPNWWRKEGHNLQWIDIADFIAEINPEIIIVGQGKFGMMKLNPGVKEELDRLGIQLIAHKTSKAVDEFNILVGTWNVLGAFHLTC